MKLYTIKCTYCGVEKNEKLSNISRSLEYRKCSHCNWHKFEAKEIILIDYYKGDPEFSNSITTNLENAPWY
jgi:hypothetical protein